MKKMMCMLLVLILMTCAACAKKMPVEDDTQTMILEEVESTDTAEKTETVPEAEPVQEAEETEKDDSAEDTTEMTAEETEESAEQYEPKSEAEPQLPPTTPSVPSGTAGTATINNSPVRAFNDVSELNGLQPIKPFEHVMVGNVPYAWDGYEWFDATATMTVGGGSIVIEGGLSDELVGY